MFDAHTHAVAPDLDHFPRRRPDFPAAWLDHDPPSAEDLAAALDDAGVDGALLVQPQGAYGHDNRYVLDAAAQDPRLHAVVSLDVTRPDRLDRLEDMMGQGAVGVRLFSIPTPERTWLDDPATDEVWGRCSETGIVVSICCLAAELDAAARMSARHTGMTVVLDHCGFVDGDLDRLAAFVPLEHVHMKVTGHVLHEAADPVRLLADLADRFGADRVLWGSDWPQVGGRYADGVAQARRVSDALPPAARDRFLGNTTRSIYNAVNDGV